MWEILENLNYEKFKNIIPFFYKKNANDFAETCIFVKISKMMDNTTFMNIIITLLILIVIIEINNINLEIIYLTYL